jgi:hypothetical protein
MGGKRKWRDSVKLLTTAFPPKPCPFRYVENGRTYCRISAHPAFAEVDPIICSNCEAYEVLKSIGCKYLSLGVDIKNYRGEGKVSLTFACGKRSWRIYDLKECEECEEKEVKKEESTDEEGGSSRKESRHAVPVLFVQEEHLKKAVREVLASHSFLERGNGLDDVYCPFLNKKGCLKPIVFEEKGLFLMYPLVDRYIEFYRIVKRKLRELELFVMDFMDLPDKSYCGLCEALLTCGRALVDLSVPSNTSLVVVGIGGGLGRTLLLVSERDVSEEDEVLRNLKVLKYDGSDGLWEVVLKGLKL